MYYTQYELLIVAMYIGTGTTACHKSCDIVKYWCRNDSMPQVMLYSKILVQERQHATSHVIQYHIGAGTTGCHKSCDTVTYWYRNDRMLQVL